MRLTIERRVFQQEQVDFREIMKTNVAEAPQQGRIDRPSQEKQYRLRRDHETDISALAVHICTHEQV